MKINLEEIEKNVNQRRKWNSVPLDEIEFYRRGVRLDIPKERVDDFMFTGLNNIEFITTGYYLKDKKVYHLHDEITCSSDNPNEDEGDK